MPQLETKSYELEHGKMDVNFMNEQIIPIEALIRKMGFIEIQMQRIQVSETADLETFETWVTANTDTMQALNSAANKLFEQTIKKVVQDGKELVLDDLGIDKRYFIIMELLDALQMPEVEEKNLSAESAGTSKPQS